MQMQESHAPAVTVTATVPEALAAAADGLG